MTHPQWEFGRRGPTPGTHPCQTRTLVGEEACVLPQISSSWMREPGWWVRGETQVSLEGVSDTQSDGGCPRFTPDLVSCCRAQLN